MVKKIYLAVPKPVKPGDNRVAISPQNIASLRLAAFSDFGQHEPQLEVLVESGAGLKTGYSDTDYESAGATVTTWEDIQSKADILVDVKQRGPEREDGHNSLVPGAVHFFYAHVEKGQGIEQLRAICEADNVSVYSPETIWRKDAQSGKQVRGTNLGFFSGVGAAHLLLEGVKLSYQRRGEGPVPFEFFPQVDGATADQITAAYENIGDLERSLNLGIIGGPTGIVSSGARHELSRAGLDFDHIYKDVDGAYVTHNQDALAAMIGQYDGLVNATVWNPGDPRIITMRQLRTMKAGTVLVDNTCDPDCSSVPGAESADGKPVVGGVRHSYESCWSDDNMFYWVGPDEHTFNAEDPTQPTDGTHVLYNAIGMVPGGTSTAVASSDAYFGMIFPYLCDIVRAVSQGTELPDNGLVVKEGKLHDQQLIGEVSDTAREDLQEFQQYLPGE